MDLGVASDQSEALSQCLCNQQSIKWVPWIEAAAPARQHPEGYVEQPDTKRRQLIRNVCDGAAWQFKLSFCSLDRHFLKRDKAQGECISSIPNRLRCRWAQARRIHPQPKIYVCVEKQLHSSTTGNTAPFRNSSSISLLTSGESKFGEIQPQPCHEPNNSERGRTSGAEGTFAISVSIGLPPREI